MQTRWTQAMTGMPLCVSLHSCQSVLLCVCVGVIALLLVCSAMCDVTVLLLVCSTMCVCVAGLLSVCSTVCHCTTVSLGSVLLCVTECVTALLLVCSTVCVSLDCCWSVLLCGCHKTTVGLFYYGGVTRLLFVCSNMRRCLWICVSLYVLSALLSVCVTNTYY